MFASTITKTRVTQSFKDLSTNQTVLGSKPYLEAGSIFAQYALGNSDDQERQLQPLLNADLVVLDDLFLARHISDSAGELLQMLG